MLSRNSVQPRRTPSRTPRRLLTQLGDYYRPYSTPDRPRPYEVDWLLDTVGLGDDADRKIVTLSGGRRRRLDVAIGIIAVRRPCSAPPLSSSWRSSTEPVLAGARLVSLIASLCSCPQGPIRQDEKGPLPYTGRIPTL